MSMPDSTPVLEREKSKCEALFVGYAEQIAGLGAPDDPVDEPALVAKIFLRGTSEQIYVSSLLNSGARGEPERHLASRDPKQIVKFVSEWDRKDRGGFFCVSTIRARKLRRKENAAETVFLHADVDFKDVAAAPESALAAVLSLEIPPSRVHRSGHGLHCYWILDRPCTDGPRIETALRKLCEVVAGDSKVCHRAALMRMPGSHNTKGGEWTPVEVTFEDDRRTYSLDCLEAWIDRQRPAIERKSAGPSLTEASNMFQEAGRDQQFKPPIDVDARLRDMVYHGDGDAGIHATQLSVTAALMERGWSVDDAVNKVLEATKLKVGDESWDWGKEEAAIRTMCTDWLRKHPRDEIEVSKDNNTDLGNARRLVRRSGGDIRYVPPWGSWLVWDGAHWRRDEDGGAMRMAKATVEEMFAKAGTINDEGRRKDFRKHALSSQSAKALNAMVKLAETEAAVVLPVRMIDADPLMLGVANGVVDLRTQSFRPGRREDYITKVAGTHFDAQAQCPNWKAFLKKVMPDDELVAYVQRSVGYVLTGLTGEEVMFILWGTGSNGKSTLLQTLFALLGDYAMGADASLLVTKRSGGATPDLVRLHGKRLVAINETQQNDVLNESRVKFITSRDTITARDLFESFFDFSPTHKTFMNTNHKPIVRGTDEGVWRRIALLPFVTTIPPDERDVNFQVRVLQPELPGILNWGLEGLSEYQRIGLGPPPAVLASTQEYRDDMDIVGQWIEERCELNAAATATSGDLYKDFELWSKEEIGFTMTAIAFGRDLAGRGFAKAKVNRARGFRGIHRRPDAPAQYDSRTGRWW